MNVYDFDNTIYDGESFIDFFFFYMKKDKSLARYILPIGLALIKYKRGKITIDEALSKYGSRVTEYYRKAADGGNALDIERFWDSHMHKIKPFYQEVRKDDDLIISGSPDFSIKEISKRLGISHYICSEVDEKTGDIKRLCIRENKVTAFFEKYPDTKIDALYTDSVNDKPLMDISDTVFLVKGNKIKRIK